MEDGPSMGGSLMSVYVMELNMVPEGLGPRIIGGAEVAGALGPYSRASINCLKEFSSS